MEQEESILDIVDRMKRLADEILKPEEKQVVAVSCSNGACQFIDFEDRRGS